MATILVVDDEKVIRDGCSRLLSSEGQRVLTASNGKEAMEILEAEAVHVILCDLKMPVMDGIEVQNRVRVEYPDLPFVVITGHGTIDTAVECMKNGAYDFISKPFRTDHLQLIVRRALEKRELEEKTRILREAHERNLYDLAAEQSRVRTIVHCMAEGVLVTNRDLEVVLQNPALARLLDLPKVPEQPTLLSRYLDEPFLAEAIEGLMERAPDRWEMVSREFRKGSADLRALSAPIFDVAGEVLGSVTVFQDITSFKELDRMKSHFVQMVSHELRSPLATVQQQLGVILEGLAGELNEKQQSLLGRSRDKIQSLLELINDLLDVAKIESGHAVQEQVPLNLGEVLNEVAAFLRERAQKQGIALELEIHPHLPLIHADRRCMEEVFTNLVSNAIQYSPDGGRVLLCAKPHGENIEVRVTDTGIGIPAEEIPKIFDKFYRVKHPRTRQIIGTGLGLAIVKGIVESHRGSVEVDSELGAGTTFRLLFPVIETRG